MLRSVKRAAHGLAGPTASSRCRPTEREAVAAALEPLARLLEPPE